MFVICVLSVIVCLLFLLVSLVVGCSVVVAFSHLYYYLTIYLLRIKTICMNYQDYFRIQGTLANSIYTDQTPRSVAPDEVLHHLHQIHAFP